MSRRQEVAVAGEAAARAFLEARGLRVLASRFRALRGEIDLVAREGSTVVFVEVKTRRTATFGPPEGAVRAPKQRQIAKVAEAFLSASGLRGAPCRFDVVAVDLAAHPARVTWIRDAFPAEGLPLL
ncbi:MAG: YraN family protein [candidate division NC10 bacterium]|nr:YraN family protein [candidate division NC10 bacterium]MBI4390722.1 YraN family protein [candidate division NC10 bacterium]